MNDCKIAERLTELRTKKGITQNELAKALSVSNKTISKWENGMSAPSLNMLITLSDFYGVTTDSLLGREDDSAQSPIPKRLSEVRRNERIMNIFSYLDEIAPENMIAIAKLAEGQNADFIPPLCEDRDHSNYLVTNDFVNIHSHNFDNNMAFVLLRNQANFDWMKNPEMQEKLVKIFELLSDRDALTVCYFLHSTACSNSFTADYVAEKVGISVEKAIEILNRLYEIKSCRKRKAHLYEGDRIIFEFNGDAMLLGIITLTYEKCHSRVYVYHTDKGAKMIVG